MARRETRGRERRKGGIGRIMSKMSIDERTKDEGYVYRWFNDINHTGQRLQAAQESGWEFVQSSHIEHVGESIEDQNINIGTRVSMCVDKSQRLGQPMMAYLMRIKKEWYDEDQAIKLKSVEEKDQMIKQTKGGITNNQEKSKFYGEVTYQP